MKPSATIAIACTSTEFADIARATSAQLQLPFTGADDTSFDYLLLYSRIEEAPGYRVELHKTGKDAPGPVFVDFVEGRIGHRRKFGGGRNQELARAVGMKPGVNPAVIDATAGLGRDSFILASLGCKVTMIERSPIIHALLENGLERARRDPESREIVEQRIRLVCADAQEYLDALAADQYPDTIYLDPMYPHRSKTALVKKEMRYFRDLVGEDLDAAGLLQTALRRARKRVVVKRPKGAPALLELPHSHVSSKNTRYDLYPAQPVTTDNTM